MRKNKVMRLICGLLAASICAGAGAAGRPDDKAHRPVEWHVSVDGDDAAAGTARAPFRHIARAAAKALPGDRVIVHAGLSRARGPAPRRQFGRPAHRV